MSSELEAKLSQLKRLHELGLLTEAELTEQKRSAIAVFMGSTPPSTASLLGGATTVDSRSSAPQSSTDPLARATTVDPSAGLPSRLGNYRVLGIIGAGGMGTVVRARHDNDGWASRQGGDVALKLIHPHIASDPAFQERFLDEAELGRRIQHPGLARVYDVVTEGPWLGTVLELIEGEELTRRIRPGGLAVDEVVSLLTPLAEALDHLHRQGIVHRDLKPANVKLRTDGRPVLLDLGIAKDLSRQGSGQTKTMTTMGTSAWMAPEQADAKTVTAAADVYSLGLIAYALLSGRMPWSEESTEHRVMANKMMGKLAPLSSVASGLPEAVSSAVMGALSVRASARPQSCGALVGSLDSSRRAAAAQARREAAAETARRAAAARKAAAEGARRETAAQARREAVAQKAAEEKTRLELAAQELALEAANAGLRLRMPDRLTTGWLSKAREVVSARIAHKLIESRAWEVFSVGTTDFRLCRVDARTYTVGSCDDDEDAFGDEKPRHSVRFTRAYGVGEFAVTQDVYEAVMGTNPSFFGGESDSAQRPVEGVSWFDAVAFCNRLSKRCGLAPAYRIRGTDVSCDFEAPGFRLPTEHEWEVAARAGADVTYSGSDDLGAVGWFGDNSGKRTHPVGQKSPNGWGLFDLSGNVREWCWDWFDSRAYRSDTMVGPVGPLSGAGRGLRGGSWGSLASDARVAYRYNRDPSYRADDLGFRLARTLP